MYTLCILFSYFKQNIYTFGGKKKSPIGPMWKKLKLFCKIRHQFFHIAVKEFWKLTNPSNVLIIMQRVGQNFSTAI